MHEYYERPNLWNTFSMGCCSMQWQQRLLICKGCQSRDRLWIQWYYVPCMHFEYRYLKNCCPLRKMRRYDLHYSSHILHDVIWVIHAYDIRCWASVLSRVQKVWCLTQMGDICYMHVFYLLEQKLPYINSVSHSTNNTPIRWVSCRFITQETRT